MPFKKGPDPRRAKGRPKGSPNKATLEIKYRARALLESPEYLAKLPERIEKNPHLEALLYQYGYGKPKQELEVKASLTTLPIILAGEETDD